MPAPQQAGDIVFDHEPNGPDGAFPELDSSSEDDDADVHLASDDDSIVNISHGRPSIQAPVNYVCSWLMRPFDEFAYTRPTIANGNCGIDAIQASAAAVIGGNLADLPPYLQPTHIGRMELRKALYEHGMSIAGHLMSKENPKIIDAREEAVLNVYHPSTFQRKVGRFWNDRIAQYYANDTSIPRGNWVEPTFDANIMSSFFRRSIFRFAPSLVSPTRVTTVIHFYRSDGKIQQLVYPNEEIVPFRDALCMFFTNSEHYLKCFLREIIPLSPEPIAVTPQHRHDHRHDGSPDDDEFEMGMTVGTADASASTLNGVSLENLAINNEYDNGGDPETSNSPMDTARAYLDEMSFQSELRKDLCFLPEDRAMKYCDSEALLQKKREALKSTPTSVKSQILGPNQDRLIEAT
jgi:hypothetical protein